jgi:hypothetical protein
VIRAAQRVGSTAQENLSWLVDFSQYPAGRLREMTKDPACDPALAELWDEMRAFIMRWNRLSTLLPNWDDDTEAIPWEVRLVRPNFEKLRGTLSEALRKLAQDGWARIPRLRSHNVILSRGQRKSYEFPPGDPSAVFLSCCVDLLQELSQNVSLCAYEKCGRGPAGGKRLFARNGRSRYCCPTCASNAQSDRYLQKPENRKMRLQRRKTTRRTARPSTNDQ